MKNTLYFNDRASRQPDAKKLEKQSEEPESQLHLQRNAIVAEMQTTYRSGLGDCGRES